MHSSLADGRWASFSLAEQLANVGSEVHRAISWFNREDRPHFEAAFDRALELLDLTIADERWRGGKLKELTRLREVICDRFYGGNWYDTPFEFLESYFMQFALAAQARKASANAPNSSLPRG